MKPRDTSHFQQFLLISCLCAMSLRTYSVFWDRKLGWLTGEDFWRWAWCSRQAGAGETRRGRAGRVEVVAKEWRPSGGAAPGVATGGTGSGGSATWDVRKCSRHWDVGCGRGWRGHQFRSAIKRGRQLPDPMMGHGEGASVLICFTKCKTEVEGADPSSYTWGSGGFGAACSWVTAGVQARWGGGGAPSGDVGTVSFCSQSTEGRTDRPGGRNLGPGPVKRKFRSAQGQDQRIAVSQRAGILGSSPEWLWLMGSSHEYLLGASFAPHGGLATRMQKWAA